MKLSVLSVLITTMLVSGFSGAAEIYNKDGNKLDLFGKIDGLHYFSDNSSEDGDQSYVRIGIRGETQITNDLTGYGTWEYQANANRAEGDDQGNYTRIGFAGLKFTDFGSLDYGRNYGVLYDVSAWTDVLPEFGGDTYGADNFMAQRGNGMLTYRNNDFFGLVDGLNFALQYQGQNSSATESNNGRSVQGQNGDGFGMSVSYDLGWGISAAAAFTNSDRTKEQNELRYGYGDKAEAYSGGLKYDANNVYLAAMYTQTYNMTRFGDFGDSSKIAGFANKAENIELVAQYQFDFGLRPSIAYLQSKGKNINGYGNEDLVKYVDIGASYYFNKNMSTYVDYKINLLDDSRFTDNAGINTDDIVAVGLVYQF